MLAHENQHGLRRSISLKGWRVEPLAGVPPAGTGLGVAREDAMDQIPDDRCGVGLRSTKASQVGMGGSRRCRD